jgi:hypothetical protein
MQEPVRHEEPPVRHEVQQAREEVQAVHQEAPRINVPKIDAKEILSNSGLQMVETDSSKARQPVPEPEPLKLGRPRRDRPATPAAADTELVQVETQNK